ncbi:MAG: F0F1 ATP synthase subunit B [Eubacteriales bacterium]
MNLDIISINIWQILISLCNLAILFLILKKFLYKPVKNVLAQRQAAIDDCYSSAAEAEKDAFAAKEEYRHRLENARQEADGIIDSAKAVASKRGDEIVAQAQNEADSIVRQAQNDAVLERKKAEEDIRRQIVDVSSAIAEKMLEREINEDDHKELIDSFIDSIGDGDGSDK